MKEASQFFGRPKLEHELRTIKKLQLFCWLKGIFSSVLRHCSEPSTFSQRQKIEGYQRIELRTHQKFSQFDGIKIIELLQRLIKIDHTDTILRQSGLAFVISNHWKLQTKINTWYWKTSFRKAILQNSFVLYTRVPTVKN